MVWIFLACELLVTGCDEWVWTLRLNNILRTDEIKQYLRQNKWTLCLADLRFFSFSYHVTPPQISLAAHWSRRASWEPLFSILHLYATAVMSAWLIHQAEVNFGLIFLGKRSEMLLRVWQPCCVILTRAHYSLTMTNLIPRRKEIRHTKKQQGACFHETGSHRTDNSLQLCVAPDASPQI